MLLPEKTINYRTFLKTTLVEALASVFAGHPDKFLQGVKVTLDFPMTRESFPATVIRFFERDIKNMGVGNLEIAYDSDVNQNISYKHYYYEGDVEFAIYALSSWDRDLMADSIVQTIAMGDMAKYTNAFYNRIYNPDTTTIPEALSNSLAVNSDTLFGFGETQMPTPWGAEDQLVYLTNYRVPVFGEFYSLPPDTGPLSNITSIRISPYMEFGNQKLFDGEIDVPPA